MYLAIGALWKKDAMLRKQPANQFSFLWMLDRLHPYLSVFCVKELFYIVSYAVYCVLFCFLFVCLKTDLYWYKCFVGKKERKQSLHSKLLFLNLLFSVADALTQRMAAFGRCVSELSSEKLRRFAEMQRAYGTCGSV